MKEGNRSADDPPGFEHLQRLGKVDGGEVRKQSKKADGGVDVEPGGKAPAISPGASSVADSAGELSCIAV